MGLDPLDEKFMRRALALAKQARNGGNHPFGALLVVNGYVRVEAENTVNDEDCTCHAELNLVRMAEKQVSEADRARSILYTSTEPCAMCAGAIFWSGIREVVYSCPASRLIEVAGYGLAVGCDTIFGTAVGTDKVRVKGPILEEEGFALHQDFWK